MAALLVTQPKLPHWTEQTSGVTARLRGVSVVNERVVWASGANGTIVRTADGGKTWRRLMIPNTSDLDFRDIDAVSERVAYVLSIGAGSASRIYKTLDAGEHWQLQFTNDDRKAFYDAMAFCDAEQGLAISDSVDGRFVILRTEDGGSHWSRIPPQSLPPALPNEGAFAASGSNIAMTDCRHAWIGTGAAARARVLRTTDGGTTWSVADTPVASGPSSGIFSVAFRDTRHGVVVGGDYKKEDAAVRNAATTSDGGATWQTAAGLGGLRSAVAHVSGTPLSWVAVGPSGADVSQDDGKTWTALPGAGFHSLAIAPRARIGWAAGEGGRIGRLDW